jgi:GT2 family glycosyltransferase
VDWINGAFLMVKRLAIEKAGVLDEDFFLYAEEAEWCSRLKKTGKMLILGKHHVYHLQGKTANMAFESTGQGYYNLYDQKGLQIMISNFLRIRKEFGIGWMLFNELNYLLVIPIFFIGVFISKIWPFQITKRYAFKDWMGYCDNVTTLISLTPRMILNRPHFYKFL